MPEKLTANPAAGRRPPVGTVWISAAFPDGTGAAQLRLIGDREEIRRRATQAALELVRRVLLEKN